MWLTKLQIVFLKFYKAYKLKNNNNCVSFEKYKYL